jgi:hypothetical protein
VTTAEAGRPDTSRLSAKHNRIVRGEITEITVKTALLRSPESRQGDETPGMRTAHRSRRSIAPRPAFVGFRFPSDVIVPAVRWYLRFSLMPVGCHNSPRHAAHSYS